MPNRSNVSDNAVVETEGRNQFLPVSLKLAGLLLALCLVPLVTHFLDRGNYVLHIFSTVYLYMLLALGLNVVTGFTGLLDLGYVGFYLVGGYTAGLLMVRMGLSYWFALPIAAIHGAIWGLLRGAPTLRLTGDYFAIVTFGFSELLFRIVKNEEWLIGGPNGFVNDIPPPVILGIELYQYWQQYYHILILLLVTLIVVYRLQFSRVGRAWKAISQDEEAAQTMGIGLYEYKSLAFAISGAIGAVGGAFFAQFQVNISAGVFEFWESILILCMIVLGGMGTIRGSLVGAAILGSLGEVLRILLSILKLPADSRYLIFGLILVLMMRFRPSGILTDNPK